MKLDTEFYRLPLRFDIERLREEVAQFSEADWRPHPQGHKGNSAVSLIGIDGDPNIDQVRGAMYPTPHLERCPYIKQVLATFQTVFGRTRLMRIDAGGEANAHVDTNYYWMHRTRVHVPIVTSPEVTFICNGKSLHMPAGESWLFNTWCMHNVINSTDTARIHLVADTVGSDAFWQIVAQAEQPFGTSPQPPVEPQFIPYDPNATPQLQTELHNCPVVMNPWEQESILTFLFEELEASPNASSEDIAQLQQTLKPFLQKWRGLWGQFGESPAGFDQYEAVLREMEAKLQPLTQRMRMPNGIEAIEMVKQGIIRMGVNRDMAQKQAAPAPVQAAPPPNMQAGGGQVAQQIPAGQPMRPNQRRRPNVTIGGQSPNAPQAPQQPQPQMGQRPQGGQGFQGMASNAQQAVQRANAADVKLDRPVFIVSAPRSGSTFLFETLMRSPDLWTLGVEGHQLYESVPRLRPANRNYESNALGAEDVNPRIAQHIRTLLVGNVKNREGQMLAPGQATIRAMEKTPKNALRIPFLNALFPDAQFIYLYREPRENISSIIEAWRSQKFMTYPRLPGWRGPNWSLLLIPGWKEFTSFTWEFLAMKQYVSANDTILSDLEKLGDDRWTAVEYGDLCDNTQAVCERLCRFMGVAWDQNIDGQPLPNSRHTLTPPQKDKWKQNEELVNKVLGEALPAAERGQAAVAKAVERAAALPPLPAPLPKPRTIAPPQPPQPNQQGRPQQPRGGPRPNELAAARQQAPQVQAPPAGQAAPGPTHNQAGQGAQAIPSQSIDMAAPAKIDAPAPRPAAVPPPSQTVFGQQDNAAPHQPQPPQPQPGSVMSQPQGPGPQQGQPMPQRRMGQGQGNQMNTQEALKSVHTTSLVPILQQLNCSLLISTYQAGKLIVARVQDGKINTHFRNFMSPMGIAHDGGRLAIGTKLHVWEFRNQVEVARKLNPPGLHDACFLPRHTHVTGDIHIHEIEYGTEGLWIANTKFSCLCTIDNDHSFVPRWRPKFVSSLAPEDRCHLNGMCLENGRPKYVTVLGLTDTPGGWRENKKNGGCILDVDTGEVVTTGLSMPHSPRVYNGQLYLLESGGGFLSRCDPQTGKTEKICELPGFTRGFDMVGPYAFIGLSQVRETAVFSGLAITEGDGERNCGVWVVDTRNGQIIGFLRFDGAVQEIFAVKALQGIRFPDVVNDEYQIMATSYVLPDAALKEVRLTPPDQDPRRRNQQGMPPMQGQPPQQGNPGM